MSTYWKCANIRTTEQLKATIVTDYETWRLDVEPSALKRKDLLFISVETRLDPIRVHIVFVFLSSRLLSVPDSVSVSFFLTIIIKTSSFMWARAVSLCRLKTHPMSFQCHHLNRTISPKTTANFQCTNCISFFFLPTANPPPSVMGLSYTTISI